MGTRLRFARGDLLDADNCLFLMVTVSGQFLVPDRNEPESSELARDAPRRPEVLRGMGLGQHRPLFVGGEISQRGRL